MKKICILIFIIILTTNTYVFADDEIEEYDSEEIIEIIQTSGTVEENITINSRAAVVIERTTHTILYGKNETEQKPMASTTKIMTRNCSA